MKLLQKILQPFRCFYNLTLLKKIKVMLLSLLSVALLGVFVVLLMYLAVSNGVFGDVPTQEELTDLSNAEASEVYSADGVLLGRYYIENRTDVKYNEVNPFLIISSQVDDQQSSFLIQPSVRLHAV